MLNKFKNNIFYIQVKKDLLVIKSIKDKKIITLNAPMPFSTSRLLIGEFTVAFELLAEGLKEFPNTLFAPVMIVHPCENIDSKLSEVEEKIFKELALNAGAKNVKIWLGEELSDDDIIASI